MLPGPEILPRDAKPAERFRYDEPTCLPETWIVELRGNWDGEEEASGFANCPLELRD